MLSVEPRCLIACGDVSFKAYLSFDFTHLAGQCFYWKLKIKAKIVQYVINKLANFLRSPWYWTMTYMAMFTRLILTSTFMLCLDRGACFTGRRTKSVSKPLTGLEQRHFCPRLTYALSVSFARTTIFSSSMSDMIAIGTGTRAVVRKSNSANLFTCLICYTICCL